MLSHLNLVSNMRSIAVYLELTQADRIMFILPRFYIYRLYFTGNLGVQDDEGFLFVTGRAKDIMKVKGFRVSPREIEEHLMEIDGVAEAAVVAVPDEVLGEAPVAVLVAADGRCPSEEFLRGHMQKALPAYKQPKHCVYVDALPKGASGKVQKRILITHVEEVL